MTDDDLEQRAAVKPTRRLGRPPAAVSSETRVRILQAAREQFAFAGYSNTSNKRIAERSGVTSAALYHYYRSKRQIFVAVLHQLAESVYGRLERAVDAHQDLGARLEAMLDESAELNRVDPMVAGFLCGMVFDAQREPELRTEVDAVHRQHGDLVRRLIADAVDRSELNADVDGQAVVDLLRAMFVGLAESTRSFGDVDRYERLTAAFKLLVRGELLTDPQGA